MGDKQVKRIRKQLKNVVEDLLPQVLTVELIQASQRQLKADVDIKLDAIDKHVRETLKAIDDRSKDTLGYLLRNVSPATPAKTEENSNAKA